jgi:hypothetical protein
MAKRLRLGGRAFGSAQGARRVSQWSITAALLLILE